MMCIEAWLPHPLTPKVFLSHSSPYPRNHCSHLKIKHKCTLLWILVRGDWSAIMLRPGHSSPVAPSYGIMGTGLPFMHQLFFFFWYCDKLSDKHNSKKGLRKDMILHGGQGRWNNFSYSVRGIVSTARKQREKDYVVLLDNFPPFFLFILKCLPIW